MHSVITIAHIVICLFLILIVLLQAGKGADMGALFGGSSQTAFGGRGAGTLLSKATTLAAILFMLTSLTLAVMGRRQSSLMDSVEPVAVLPTPPPLPVSPDKNAAPVPKEVPLHQETSNPATASH